MFGRFRTGVLAALPLAPGPALFGASFGLLAADAGLSWSAAVLMSATTFAGSAQFAAATVLETGGGAAAAVVAAVLLNARYIPLSVSVASIFPGSRGRRLVESQLIVDESWALSGRSGRFEYPVLVGAGLLFYVLWVGGTAAGTLVGPVRPRRDRPRRSVSGAVPRAPPPVRPRPALACGRSSCGRDHARAHPGGSAGGAPRRGGSGVPDRTPTLSAVWIVVGVVGAATVLCKAAGPVFLGRRELPPRLLGVVEVLAPAMLAALVVTQLVGGDRELVLDAPRLLGVAVAAATLWVKPPLIVVIVIAGAVAGLVRLFA